MKNQLYLPLILISFLFVIDFQAYGLGLYGVVYYVMFFIKGHSFYVYLTSIISAIAYILSFLFKKNVFVLLNVSILFILISFFDFITNMDIPARYMSRTKPVFFISFLPLFTLTILWFRKVAIRMFGR